MGRKTKIAFAIYLIGILTYFAFGFAYLSCSTFMPYHEQAVGKKFAELSIGLQALIQGMIKVASGAFFSIGIIGLTLLFIPFRNGDKWAKYALPIMAIIWNSFLLYASGMIALKTNASTPWLPSAIGIGMILIAFYLIWTERHLNEVKAG